VGVKVDAARSEDFPEVFILLGQLWPGRVLDEKAIHRVYLHNLDSEMKKYYVARGENGLVGFMTLHVITNLWAQGCLLQIEELVVNEAYRGQGVGRQMIDQALALGEERGCCTVEVTSAFHRAEAHRFYESCGFKKAAYHFIRE